MRPDFKKLLCEHERFNREFGKISKGWKKAHQRDASNPDYEEWAPGAKRGIKRNAYSRSKKTKEFAENLSVLKNFLVSASGRKWNDVYSEITQFCPKTSVIGAHIYQHLFQYVILEPVIDDTGAVCYPPHERTWYYGANERRIFSRKTYKMFYVEPSTGILRVAPQKIEKKESQRLREKRDAFEKRIEPLKWAVRPSENGPWFWAFFAKPKAKDGPVTGDCYQAALPMEKRVPYPSVGGYSLGVGLPGFHGEPDYLKRLSRYYGTAMYCYSLKQMNKRDLRRHGLRNEP